MQRCGNREKQTLGLSPLPSQDQGKGTPLNLYFEFFIESLIFNFFIESLFLNFLLNLLILY